VVLLASGRAIQSATAAIADTSLPAVLAVEPAIPSASFAVLPVPVLDVPADPYTNVATVTISGTVDVGPTPGSHVVRIYRGATTPVLVGAVPVGRLPEFSLPNVGLLAGVNEFTATLSGASGTSKASTSVRYIYTTTKPRIAILAPLRGAVISTPTAAVEGRVPAGASVVVRNLTDSSGAATTADSHGSFGVVITLDAGTNSLLVSVTDRAGNINTSNFSVLRAKTTHP